MLFNLLLYGYLNSVCDGVWFWLIVFVLFYVWCVEEYICVYFDELLMIEWFVDFVGVSLSMLFVGFCNCYGIMLMGFVW